MANSDVTTFSQLQGALETVKDYIDTADEIVTNRVVQTENNISTLQTNTYTKTETDALIAEVLQVAGEKFGTQTSGNWGYVKFSNGLILQWCGSSGSISGTTATWPTAWTGHFTYRAAVTRQSGTATDVTNIFNYQHVTETTGLILSSSSTVAVTCIGIGY